MAVAVAACGGDDGNDDEAVTPAPTEATTTVVTTPPATDPPPTEVETTTTETPTTTATPATTIDPEQALAAEVERDFRRARRLELEASMDPTNKRAVKRAVATRTGPAEEAIAAYFQGLVDSRYAIRESVVADASTTVEVPAARVGEGIDVVELQECEIDPWVVVEVGAAPDGSDAIVDDATYAHRRLVILRMVDSSWKVEGTRSLGEWVGVEECPSE